MKTILALFCAALFSTSVFATVPDVVIDFQVGFSGYETVGGHLASPPASPVGITIAGGGVKFSTLTDRDGNWAITLRQFGLQAEVTAWDFSNPTETSHPLRILFK